MTKSGIEVKDEIKTMFQEMKVGHKHKFAVLKISEDQKYVEVDRCHGAIKTLTMEEDQKVFDELMDTMCDEECRYILYDFSFKGDVEGGTKPVDKIGLIPWISDNAKVKTKMVYASTKDTVKKVCTGIGKEVQINDMADLKNYKEIMEKVTEKS